eukprot:TRINITY_DN73902_c0_g1_i1.p1 TRINITY_DN73902_c0_g1~~TRINITY_DN73902_c0_g1_i1.p1  ORF type:complete len:465 (-),score=54.96 TRINITY_DN73902_c0_g1_i1:36-1430(-)
MLRPCFVLCAIFAFSLPSATKNEQRACSPSVENCLEYRSNLLLQLNEGNKQSRDAQIVTQSRHQAFSSHKRVKDAPATPIQKGPFALWVEAHRTTFFLGVASWMLLALMSARPQNTRNDDQGRDMFWDVAKFILIVFVLDTHLSNDMLYLPWFMDVMMPGFMMISGFLQQKSRAGVLDKTVVKRVIRDNVMNNVLFYLVLLAFGQESEDGCLWYLWALAVYRICLFPVFHAVKEHFGQPGVAAFLLAIAVFYCNLTSDWPVDWTELGKIMLLGPGMCWEIPRFAFYYFLGLSIDYKAAREAFSNTTVSVLSCAFLLVHAILVPVDDVFLVSRDASLKWLQLVYFSLLSLAFLACVSPIASITQGPLRHAVKVMADGGSRTLYGYYLHMLIRFLVVTEQFAQVAVDLDSISWCLRIFLETLFMASLCSPLAETCFKGLVSPQWILDLGSRIVKQLDPWSPADFEK